MYAALRCVAGLTDMCRQDDSHDAHQPQHAETGGASAGLAGAFELETGRGTQQFKVITHNLLSDAYMQNFCRDKRAVNKRAVQAGHSATFPQSGTIRLDTHHYAWVRRAERIQCDLGAPWNSADIQCLQEVTSTSELPSCEHFSFASSQSPDDRRDNAVVRWRNECFREVCHLAECMGGKKPAIIVVLERVGAGGCSWMVVVNVHLPGGEAARKVEEMERILLAARKAEAAAGIESGGASWIVAGDFNSPVNSVVGDQLRSRGFLEVADNGPNCATFFADAYGMNGEKIDHIFYRPCSTGGLSCRKFAVLGTDLDTVDLELLACKREPRGPLAISDHLPLWAEFALRRRPARRLAAGGISAPVSAKRGRSASGHSVAPAGRCSRLEFY